jgi:hypothetical protein
MRRHHARPPIGALIVITGAVTLGGVVARGQETAPPPTASATPDLAARYRLHEVYTDGTRGARGAPGAINGHRVAFRETIFWIIENPQAAPSRKEATTHVIYSERPAEVSNLDERMVSAAVRRYESVRLDPLPEGRAPRPPLFDNLTIWFEERTGDPPLVLALTPGRRLRDREYMLASRQVFVPSLAFALPDLPLRIGDSYEVGRRGIEALIAVPVSRGSVRGTLQSVQDDPASPGRKKATLDLIGRVDTARGTTSIHALILFSFANVDAIANTNVRDAVGRIDSLSLAQEASGPADANERLKMHLRRELVLERRALADPNALAIPNPAPTATVTNSWLSYEDPEGLFRFEHPQEFQAAPGTEEETLDLVRFAAEGPDVISVRLLKKGEIDADKLRAGRFASWADDGVKPVAGAAGWLPERLWPGRRVYRFEAALPMSDDPTKPAAGPSSRIHFDGYVIQTGQDNGLYVESTTPQDDPGPFRVLVEQMIKTVAFDGGASPAPAPGPGPAAPAPAPAGAAPTPAPAGAAPAPALTPTPATIPPPGS